MGITYLIPKMFDKLHIAAKMMLISTHVEDLSRKSSHYGWSVLGNRAARRGGGEVIRPVKRQIDI